MRKNKKNIISSESGEVVVEATLVMLITIFITIFLMNIAVAVYHQELVTAEANRAATDVANNYGEMYKDPIYQFQDESYFRKCDPYRYIINDGKLLMLHNIKKAKWYACYRLSQNEFSHETTNSWDNVVITVSENSLGMNVLNVEISRTYEMFSMAPLVMFNLKPTHTVTATGKAICYDVIHDMSKAELKQDLVNKLIGASALLQGISNVEVIIDAVKDVTD